MNRPSWWVSVWTRLLAGVWSACTSVRQHKTEPEFFFEGTALELARAIRRNRLGAVERLAGQVELNRIYEQDMTLLAWAMLQKQEVALRLLLRLGADPNLKDSENTQPVALAAGISNQNKFLQILLAKGGNPNSYQQDRPAVLVALLSDFWDNVLILLDHQANIDQADKEGHTLLTTCGDLNQFERAVYLIGRGANPSHLDKIGAGIAYSVQENRSGAETAVWQARCKQLLQQRGIHFPAERPYEKPYQAIRERWYQTEAGGAWQQRLNAMGADPNSFGRVWEEAKQQETADLQAWMKANNIATPPRPD